MLLRSFRGEGHSYNPSNELVMTSNGTYAYDYNGNLTSKTNSSGTTNYAWDFENRLTQVTLPSSGGTITFKYDPFGRRIQKVFTQNSTTTTTNYLYDGDSEIEQVDQNGSVLAKYAQGQNIDEPLAESVGGATYDYQQDGLGSVTSLTNGSGALAQTYTFDSFGNTTNSQGSLANPFRFAGRDFDTETSLYSNRARHLDPNTGRFLSEDPVRYLGGPNFYDYVRNDPANLVDPFGLSPVCTWVGTTELGSSTTATRRYTSPWAYQFATQAGGGPDEESGVGWATIDCHWTRTYVRQVWQNTLYLNTYLCVDHMACGLNLVWFKFSTDTKRKYLGEEPGGIEPRDVRWPVGTGWESELMDWAFCTQPRLVPPN